MDGRFLEVTLTTAFLTFAMSQSVSPARMRTHVTMNFDLEVLKDRVLPAIAAERWLAVQADIFWSRLGAYLLLRP